MPSWSVTTTWAPERGAVVAIGVTERGVVGDEAEAILTRLGLDATSLVADVEPGTAAGSTTVVPLMRGARRLVLVGLGAARARDIRAAGAAAGRNARGADSLVVGFGAGDETALVEGVVLGSWGTPKWTAGGVRRGAVAPGTVVAVGSHDETAVARAVVRTRATLVARNLVCTPSNIKNPPWLAERAREVAASSGLGVTVFDEARLRREGFGGILAVGGGSVTPPRLVELRHRPRRVAEGSPHVVLVGKGITFDTGGLDIKPAAGMLSMKTDMSGAAIVLAVLGACRDLGIPLRVTGLFACAENAVSGTAYRPSDVVTVHGGTTVEIGNTDAEGRMVLVDALSYADERLDPDIIVDVATLTGAARVALARSMAPLYTTDDALRDALVAAGESTGETLWPFPLVEDYRQALDSEVADINHVATKTGGGSITAALFLREFVGNRRWAHLDIAGPGRSDVDTGILSKGGTGFGARALLRWLEGVS